MSNIDIIYLIIIPQNYSEIKGSYHKKILKKYLYIKKQSIEVHRNYPLQVLLAVVEKVFWPV